MSWPEGAAAVFRAPPKDDGVVAEKKRGRAEIKTQDALQETKNKKNSRWREKSKKKYTLKGIKNATLPFYHLARECLELIPYLR